MVTNKYAWFKRVKQAVYMNVYVYMQYIYIKSLKYQKINWSVFLSTQTPSCPLHIKGFRNQFKYVEFFKRPIFNRLLFPNFILRLWNTFLCFNLFNASTWCCTSGCFLRGAPVSRKSCKTSRRVGWGGNVDGTTYWPIITPSAEWFMADINVTRINIKLLNESWRRRGFCCFTETEPGSLSTLVYYHQTSTAHWAEPVLIKTLGLIHLDGGEAQLTVSSLVGSYLDH